MYQIEFTPRARKDAASLKAEPAAFHKLEKLIEELKYHPKTGTGKPEMLKYRLSGLWSRRINKKHRLVYSINDEKIIVKVISATGHYGDK